MLPPECLPIYLVTASHAASLAERDGMKILARFLFLYCFVIVFGDNLVKD
jgi:hypothetical protein